MERKLHSPSSAQAEIEGADGTPRSEQSSLCHRCGARLAPLAIEMWSRALSLDYEAPRHRNDLQVDASSTPRAPLDMEEVYRMPKLETKDLTPAERTELAALLAGATGVKEKERLRALYLRTATRKRASRRKPNREKILV